MLLDFEYVTSGVPARVAEPHVGWLRLTERVDWAMAVVRLMKTEGR